MPMTDGTMNPAICRALCFFMSSSSSVFRTSRWYQNNPSARPPRPSFADERVKRRWKSRATACYSPLGHLGESGFARMRVGAGRFVAEPMSESREKAASFRSASWQKQHRLASDSGFAQGAARGNRL
jgi:hypothetical protein